MDTAEEEAPPSPLTPNLLVTWYFSASTAVMNKDMMFISCPAAQQTQSMAAPPSIPAPAVAEALNLKVGQLSPSPFSLGWQEVLVTLPSK